MKIFHNLKHYIRKRSFGRSYDISSIDYEDFMSLTKFPEWIQREVQEYIKTLDSIKRADLYLINFNRQLSTAQAEKELNKLGLRPANIIETIVFVNKYTEKVSARPIISLNAYHDISSSYKGVFKSLSRKNYGLCLCYTSLGFERPGEIEYAEAQDGVGFMAGVSFLVKENMVRRP